MPHVSVVIPAFNAAWCICRAVDSVLAQTWRDYELLVVDDGSTDDTAARLASYAGALRLISKANGGLSSARNAGIAQAKGEYIAFLDADDWWMPEKLERQVALLDSRPEIVFCSTTTVVQTPEGRRLVDWGCRNKTESTLACIFSANAHVAGSGSSVMARRDALRLAGEFDVTLRSLEDIDMWMRLAALGDYACIDEPLSVILKSVDSMSGNLDVMRAAAIRVMHKNRHLLPPEQRGGFWRAAFAGVLADYAKWEYRRGRTFQAIWHLLQSLALAPLARGRMLAGLLLAVLTRQSL